MPTKQETFDQVAEHLLRQNAKSLNEKGKCVDRGENGCKCAVACLIPDEEYDPTLAGFGVTHPDRMRALRRLGHDLSLCGYLQKIHDSVSVACWQDNLHGLAVNNHLSTKVLDRFDWNPATSRYEEETPV